MRPQGKQGRFKSNPSGVSRAAFYLAMVLALVLVGCDGVVTPTPVKPVKRPTPIDGTTPTVSVIGEGPTLEVEEEEMEGLRFGLSEGSEQVATDESLPLAPSQDLDGAATDAVLDRLPGIEGAAGDAQDFRLPVSSLPAPRPGETIDQAFPPEASGAPVVEPVVGPLQVLRFSPEGPVDLAPYLSITFDQPMVALASVGDLSRLQVPVTLDPEPEGKWRWVGTKTLMFEPVTRFAMATEYTVIVPAGTESANGVALEEAVRWSFSTPPATVTSTYPSGGPHSRTPVIVLTFDQRIDPVAVMSTVSLSAEGKSYALSRLTLAGLGDDDGARRMAERAGEGRWLALKADNELPYDTTVTINVGPGTPSAEGPRVTEAVQSFSFTTYGPLRVVETSCGWGDNCTPMAPWAIEFSNPLDEEAFDPSQVSISPELPDAQITVRGDYMQIRGVSAGRTTYKVTLDSTLRDQFDQTLERDKTVTFKVGSANPSLSVPSGTLVTLDPQAAPAYSVWTINYGRLHVRAYRVQVEDWEDFVSWRRKANSHFEAEPPGDLVWDERVRVASRQDTLTETVLDLTKYYAESRDGAYQGHLVLVIEPEEGLIESILGRRTPRIIRIWVQATELAADALVDYEEAIAWVTRLSDGTPVEGAALTLSPGGVTGSSDAEGLATLKLSRSGDSEALAYLVAKLDGDTAILPQDSYGWAKGGWRATSPGGGQRWYVLDDRGIYRPGETVQIKGWVRNALQAKAGDQLTPPAAGTQLYYDVIDVRGNTVAEGDLKLNALGGFHMEIALPEAINLGPTTLRLSLGSKPDRRGASHSHGFEVQEFRRPEFEVSATASEGPYFVGDEATATVDATYYAGGPLPNADASWTVSSSASSYRPPNWDDFTFGFWVPWWRMGGWSHPSLVEGSVQTFDGKTDASGSHTIAIQLQEAQPPRPHLLSAEAVVMDVNRQAWAASASLLVHPADVYVGLKSEKMFVEQGDPIEMAAIVTDLDGEAVAGRPVTVRCVRVRWKYERGEWIEAKADEQICNLTSTADPLTCSFETPQGGRYQVTALVEDSQGRLNMTKLTRWVSGGKRPVARRVEKEESMLIPDKAEYQPGDVAEIMVQTPFVPAEGLLTLRANGVISTERFQMSESSTVLRIPIVEAHMPNVHVQVDLTGAAYRLDDSGEPLPNLAQRPAYASGQLDLSVPAYSRTLSMTVEPRERELEPGGETVVDVRLTDADGKPVENAEVAIIVVDEAVLALTGYALADPIALFYPHRAASVGQRYARSYVLLADPNRLELDMEASVAQDAVFSMAAPGAAPQATRSMVMEEAPAEMAKGMADGEEASPIRMRTDFSALATFAPEVPTDADGTALVLVELPDNLTRYRVMAVAVAGDQHFGKAESTLTARLPLMVRPSPPRFLNFGDEIELPIVLQNQTDEPMVVDVALQATQLMLLGAAGQKVTVPARDRVEVRFPMRTESVGTARIQVGAASGSWADAAEMSFPVYTPATTEAFATYGTLDEGAIAQPVMAPTDAYTQFGGLEISTSSTAVQALTDAVLYLVDYPFLCSEQLASRIIAVAALQPVLDAFDAEGLPEPDDLVKATQRDVDRLVGLQNGDGGFPIWRKGYDSWPYHSIHAAHALTRARDQDLTVDGEALAMAKGYLRDIERHYPSYYSQTARDTLTAYALYVRYQMGDVDTARARRLFKEAGPEGLCPEALGWLLTVMSDDPGSQATLDEILHYLGNRVSETAGAANFVTNYREQDGYLLLSSNRRADGIILEGLIRVTPDSDLIPKLVKGLLAHRKAGRWGNTQENVFILLALDRYFQTYEAQTPDFVARVWLGEQYVAEFPFEGRSTEYQATSVPMSYLAEAGGEQTLVLSKEGDGRLYYRLGLRYAPTDLDLPPYEAGFAVERAYEAVDDPEDVWRDDDGVWHIRAGARVRIRLRLVAPSRRYHVALIDPLPAGLESMNPALAVTGSIPQDTESKPTYRYWWWRWTWYEHQNLRDDRTEAFASLLWSGIHTYTYVARATTPGRYVVPPAKAEEMYSPEVFGRSATEKVIVE